MGGLRDGLGLEVGLELSWRQSSCGKWGGVEVGVVLQLGLCWRLDSEQGGTFLELNGDVEDGAYIGCWNRHA